MAIAEKSIMRFFILFFFSSFIIFNLYSEESYECIASAKKFEKKYNLPDNLLVSVALTESGKKIKNGDLVLAIPSNGIHSNGFSLVRKILKVKKNKINKNK